MFQFNWYLIFVVSSFVKRSANQDMVKWAEQQENRAIKDTGSMFGYLEML